MCGGMCMWCTRLVGAMSCWGAYMHRGYGSMHPVHMHHVCGMHWVRASAIFLPLMVRPPHMARLHGSGTLGRHRPLGGLPVSLTSVLVQASQPRL